MWFLSAVWYLFNDIGHEFTWRLHLPTQTQPTSLYFNLNLLSKIFAKVASCWPLGNRLLFEFLLLNSDYNGSLLKLNNVANKIQLSGSLAVADVKFYESILHLYTTYVYRFGGSLFSKILTITAFYPEEVDDQNV